MAPPALPAPVPLHGWGMQPVVHTRQLCSEDLERITRDAVLSRGLGRAYGDAALPPRGHPRPIAKTVLADRILSFDPETAVLRAEAGLSLRNLHAMFLRRGYFTPVSPGTAHVTLGGAVAADIHGKNHHVHGTFSNFVRALKMRVADGRVLEVSRTEHPDLFWATVGGMGLTGHMLEVEVQLEKVPSPWILEESRRFGSLAEVFAALNASADDWPMTVAWVDTSARGDAAGRGILICGRWATREEAPPHPPEPKRAIPVPFTFPSGLLNRWSIRLANAIWYAKHGAEPVRHVVHPDSFFYQLDIASDWNRAYGRKGFTQYQCVMPSDLDVYSGFLELFQRLGGCSFVTVFKDCGPAGEGMLSFPQEGTSMALDIPLGRKTPALVRALNAYVIEHGGRVYLAKDALSTAEEFRAMYPRYTEFAEARRAWDPELRFASAQSVRLMGDSPRV